MLSFARIAPRAEKWSYQVKAQVDLTPWRYAKPCGFTLMSCVFALYLLFSPIGLVGGLSAAFLPIIAVLVALNVVAWAVAIRRVHGLPSLH